MHPKHIRIAGYSYNLPESKIAYHPLPERDQSKLLIWNHQNIREDVYKNIADYLPEGSLLIFNNTKVIPARILFKKPSGAFIELFCLEPFGTGNEYSTMMNTQGSIQWKCMIGGASKWKSGYLEKKIIINNEEVILTAGLKAKLSDAYITKFSWLPAQYTFAEVLDHAGEMPLPPYIKRNTEEADKQRYQTIYAAYNGSVAAPTAGLHFTNAIFQGLNNKKIKTDFVTLHVSAGTFKPVKAVVLEDHEMHAEWMEIPVETIENILKNLQKNIIAVGTTSLRTLESLYWMGVKAYLNHEGDEEFLTIKQWDVYNAPLSDQSVDAKLSLQSLISWLIKNKKEKLVIKTEIMIVPGYKFKLTKALVTNFHQPNSTLLLLIAAGVGEKWRKIYEYALQNNFRFLSYGDGCLIFLAHQ
jgi:S-adenosylmethionine:tRNA ribosyltransferase-isomerase